MMMPESRLQQQEPGSTAGSRLSNQSTTTAGFEHHHYANLTFHPGLTATIACSFILLLLAGYLWSKKIQQGSTALRTCCCSFSGEETRNEAEEDIEKGQQQKVDSLLKAASETDSENQLLDGENLKTGGEHRIESLLVQSANKWSASMSPINTKAFPQSPIIVLTPATPLPQHHVSVDELEENFFSAQVNKLGDPTTLSFSSSEELCISAG